MEKEALAVVWGCEKFHLYLYGTTFSILSDHKPLEILYSDKGKPSPRVLRWGLRLQSYNFTIKHIAGGNNPADALSRIPLPSLETENCTRQAEEFINSVVANAIPKSVTLNEVLIQSEADPIISKVVENIKTGCWKNNPELKPYALIKHELTFKKGMLLRGTMLVIPISLRERILKLAHQYHQGISKTKALLREKVWWPGINKEVESLIKACVACISTTSREQMEPLSMTTMPGRWETLHVDLYGPLPSGDNILGIIDSCSRWPELHILRSTTSQDIKEKLELSFYQHGKSL